MADSQSVLSSVLNVEKSLSFPSAADMDNQELSGSNEDHIPLTNGKLKLCWIGDFTSLKTFVVSMLRLPVFELLQLERRKFIVAGNIDFMAQE